MFRACFYKRALDLCLASFGILVLAPLFLVCALLIKLTSRGPVIYRHARIGKDGVAFQCYKFRSLYVDADQDELRRKQMVAFISGELEKNGGASSTKVINKKFITPVGGVLRKYSVDEFPQLWNVLRGDMSLVGPRPLLPYEYASYKPWHHQRNAVTPGCTGLWQVSGRSKCSFDDMVAMDIDYIKRWSLLLDLQIIFKTIPVMLFGRGGE